MSTPHTAEQALDVLRRGNLQFVQAIADDAALVSHVSKSKMSGAQIPFAAVLGCADSRVPAELIFNQAFGDLFVVRVAGNVATPTQIASLEFTCVKFGTPLILVLGHTQCGAVQATLEHIATGEPAASPALNELVNTIKPAVEAAVKITESPDEQIHHASQANIRATVAALTENSTVLQERVSAGALSIVGAEYDIASGAVEFFD